MHNNKKKERDRKLENFKETSPLKELAPMIKIVA